MAAYAAANPDILSFDEGLDAYLTPSVAENDFINDVERAAAALVETVRYSISQRKFEELFGVADDILKKDILGVLSREIGPPHSSDARVTCGLIGGALIILAHGAEQGPQQTGTEGYSIAG